MSRKKKAKYPGRYKDGKLLCHCVSKRTGKPCEAFAVKGREVCYHHGGRTPRGIDHPSTKTGKYSKSLPARLFGLFSTAVEDPDLVTVYNEIALLDTRIHELAGVLSGRGLLDLWSLLEQSLKTLTESLEEGKENLTAARDAASEIGSVVNDALIDTDTWLSIERVVESRRKLVETESKRLTNASQSMTMAELALIMKSIVQIITSRVHDPSIRREISRDLEELVYTGPQSLN